MNQDDDTNLEESEAEKVGYAKPPRQNRFKKRQSGHRQGRPRGRPNVAKAASKIFSMRVPVKLGEQVVNLPALEALIRVHGAKAMHGDRKSQRAMSVIMEKLGFFDEKGDSENKGVMILRNS